MVAASAAGSVESADSAVAGPPGSACTAPNTTTVASSRVTSAMTARRAMTQDNQPTWAYSSRIRLSGKYCTPLTFLLSPRKTLGYHR